ALYTLLHLTLRKFGMEGVNLIQDGTAKTEKPPNEAAFFVPRDRKCVGVWYEKPQQILPRRHISSYSFSWFGPMIPGI
ncbi:MAG: hypothetical protein DI538_29360, partial [Azospira oryzae]